MKSPEELNALREEVEKLNKKLADLSEEELKHVTGGLERNKSYVCNNPICIRYGQHVGVSIAGPEPGGRGNCLVCNYCGELITEYGYLVYV